nr:hypothetical protein [Tanacetum cinerariifolium]
MGKTFTKQPSLKIAKKQPLNTLKEVPKFKVYRATSSNFMAIVQKYTGNESRLLPSTPPPTTLPVVSLAPTPVIQIDDHNSPDPSLDYSTLDYSFDPSLDYSTLDYSFDPSLDFSVTPSFDSSPDSNLDTTFVPFDYSVNPSLDSSIECSPISSLDNTFVPYDYTYCSYEELGSQLPQDHVMDFMNEIELRNIESWLFDIDPTVCTHEAPFVPVNTYQCNYNFSSIM